MLRRALWILAALLLLAAPTEGHSKLSAALAALKPHTVRSLECHGLQTHSRAAQGKITCDLCTTTLFLVQKLAELKTPQDEVLKVVRPHPPQSARRTHRSPLRSRTSACHQTSTLPRWCVCAAIAPDACSAMRSSWRRSDPSFTSSCWRASFRLPVRSDSTHLLLTPCRDLRWLRHLQLHRGRPRIAALAAKASAPEAAAEAPQAPRELAQG